MPAPFYTLLKQLRSHKRLSLLSLSDIAVDNIDNSSPVFPEKEISMMYPLIHKTEK